MKGFKYILSVEVRRDSHQIRRPVHPTAGVCIRESDVIHVVALILAIGTFRHESLEGCPVGSFRILAHPLYPSSADRALTQHAACCASNLLADDHYPAEPIPSHMQMRDMPYIVLVGEIHPLPISMPFSCH